MPRRCPGQVGAAAPGDRKRNRKIPRIQLPRPMPPNPEGTGGCSSTQQGDLFFFGGGYRLIGSPKCPLSAASQGEVGPLQWIPEPRSHPEENAFRHLELLGLTLKNAYPHLRILDFQKLCRVSGVGFLGLLPNPKKPRPEDDRPGTEACSPPAPPDWAPAAAALPSTALRGGQGTAAAGAAGGCRGSCYKGWAPSESTLSALSGSWGSGRKAAGRVRYVVSAPMPCGREGSRF
jgi:hypothetical protein